MLFASFLEHKGQQHRDHRRTAVFRPKKRIIWFPDRRRAEHDDACCGGGTVLTLFPVQLRLVDCILCLRFLEGLHAHAGNVSHKHRWLPRDVDQLLPTHTLLITTEGHQVVVHMFSRPALTIHSITGTCNANTATNSSSSDSPWGLSNKMFLTAAMSSADVVLLLPSSSADVPNGKRNVLLVSIICSSGSLSGIVSRCFHRLSSVQHVLQLRCVKAQGFYATVSLWVAALKLRH